MVRGRFVALLICVLSASVCCAQDVISPKEARHRAELGVKALQQWYDRGTGLYLTTGWWNSANAITVVADYMRVSGSKKYVGVLKNTFERAQITVPKEKWADPKKEMTGFPGFLNKYYDDEGWWALAWIDAYDVTHDALYLAMAQSIFEDMAGGWDATCGGGIWWSKDRTYKNAIANELFLSVATHLAMRAQDVGKYNEWAAKEFAWFRRSGMINGDHLVNDGLVIDKETGACRNNGKTIWTYNQGVLVGALAEWSRSNWDAGVLDQAKLIANAALVHFADKDGVLHEPCEPKCGADGVQFKGIFVRNLGALNAVSPEARYGAAIAVNAESIWMKNRTAENTLGLVWSGPPGVPDAATQSSAMDVMVGEMLAKRK